MEFCFRFCAPLPVGQGVGVLQGSRGGLVAEAESRESNLRRPASSEVTITYRLRYEFPVEQRFPTCGSRNLPGSWRKKSAGAYFSFSQLI
jgi:hypothetical protein